MRHASALFSMCMLTHLPVLVANTEYKNLDKMERQTCRRERDANTHAHTRSRTQTQLTQICENERTTAFLTTAHALSGNDVSRRGVPDMSTLEHTTKKHLTSDDDCATANVNEGDSKYVNFYNYFKSRRLSLAHRMSAYPLTPFSMHAMCLVCGSPSFQPYILIYVTA